MSDGLPPWMHVIVRGWLNSNQIVLRGRDESCVVDSGHLSHAAATLDLLRGCATLGGAPVDRLVNTLCHSDHVGGNAALVRAYGCAVTVPEPAARQIAEWDQEAMWLSFAGQRCERFGYDSTVAVGASIRMGESDWIALAAPGHDAAAVMYWSPEWRILASGDALWENGMGVVLAEDGDLTPYDLAADTLATIERLDPAWILPGHGAPFASVSAALARARERVEVLKSDPRKAARHVMKVMLIFSLLESGRFEGRELPAMMASVPVYRDLNARYFALAPGELATLLVGELERARVVEHRNGAYFPTIPA